MPATVIATRGIPASGKTTWVTEMLRTLPSGTAARINNDDLATMLYTDPWAHISPETSDLLASLRAQTLLTLLRSGYETVFIDNTNLSVSSLRDLESITLQHGAQFIVNDQFLRTPFDTAMQRNEARDNPVPSEVMRSMHRRAQALKPWKPLLAPLIQPYDNSPLLPPAYIFDIDGTLAHKHPDRDIYDGSKAHLDTPDPTLAPLVNLLSISAEIIIMSGRSEDHRDVTQHWLDTHIQFSLPLLMRRSRDYRPDWIVKYELFDEHVRDRYHVKAVFDDRDQVVRLWRDCLGLRTYQVADGDF